MSVRREIAVHPFLDGNGRIGRLLISLLLCVWELMLEPPIYLSAYFEENRQAYYDCLLAVSQRSEWNAWLEFFLDGVAAQSGDAVRHIQRLQGLRERYRERVQATRAAARLLQEQAGGYPRGSLWGKPQLRKAKPTRQLCWRCVGSRTSGRLKSQLRKAKPPYGGSRTVSPSFRGPGSGRLGHA